MMLCAPAEVRRAEGIANAAFAKEALSLGCRVQLGMQIVLAALAALPSVNRAEVIDAIEGRLDEARGTGARAALPMAPERQARFARRYAPVPAEAADKCPICEAAA